MKSVSGVKFGKTEAGAVWLDAARTSPFRFYQFWLNTPDSEVVSYLKFFTFLERAEIEELATITGQSPERRLAQLALASELTTLVHGEDQAARAEHASAVIFSDGIATLPVDDVLAVFEDVPSIDLPVDQIGGDGIGLVDLLTRAGLAPSKGEARRLVQGGGVYVNNRRATDPATRVTWAEAIEGRLLILRKGQREQRLVRLL
jgi:tyrosyl-tRNA synthetase